MVDSLIVVDSNISDNSTRQSPMSSRDEIMYIHMHTEGFHSFHNHLSSRSEIVWGLRGGGSGARSHQIWLALEILKRRQDQQLGHILVIEEAGVAEASAATAHHSDLEGDCLRGDIRRLEDIQIMIRGLSAHLPVRFFVASTTSSGVTSVSVTPAQKDMSASLTLLVSYWGASGEP